MKIFVSHSIKDKKILENLQNIIAGHNLELLIAEHEFEPNHTITEKIKKLIEKADIGLVLLTKDGINSGFVREEIGYLEAKKIKTIMVIEKGKHKEYGGFKYGVDFIEMDPAEPDQALEKIKKIFHQEYKRITNEKQSSNGILIIIGIVLGVLFLGSSD